MKFVVTGAAGFIGAHLCKALLQLNHDVTAIDRFSDYYPPSLKRLRVKELGLSSTVGWREVDLAVEHNEGKSETSDCDMFVHLAAQPGVRVPLAENEKYIRDNVRSFSNALSMAVKSDAKLFVYASSSSVYGANAQMPFRESEPCLEPLSFYGVTKLMNERVASLYESEYGIQTIGCRFFSVYGPWGRPDMAYWKIAQSLHRDVPFTLNGDGSVRRDFTHVSDIIRALLGIVASPPDSLPSVVNIGGSHDRSLLEVIAIMEHAFERSLQVKRVSEKREDAPRTLADNTRLGEVVPERPMVPIEEGLSDFADWFKSVAGSNLRSDLGAVF